MAKKKVAIDDLNIKLADGKKSKASKPQQHTIDSPMTTIEIGGREKNVPVVDYCITLSQQIENLTAEKRMHEGTLIDAAQDAKNEQADADNFVKTVNVSGTEMKIQIQFKDAYSKMDISMESPLQQIFGEKYAVMFVKETVSTVREGMMEALKDCLGDDFDRFFDTDESIKPTKDFQANYFALRKSLKADQKATVAKVLEAAQAKPSVKYPK